MQPCSHFVDEYHCNGVARRLFFSLDTSRRLYALHAKFLFDAKDIDEMECLYAPWVSPLRQYLEIGNDRLVACNQHKLRLMPEGEPRCVLFVVADDAYGEYGCLHFVG